MRGVRPASGDSGAPPPGFALIVRDIDRRKPSSVLNLGSGVHFLLEQTLSDRFPNMEIVSVDIADNAKEISLHHTYHKCDLNLEPLDLGKKFDVIVATEVIEHLATDTYFWKTIRLCSHVSTRVILSTPNLASLFCRLELLLGLQPHVLESSMLNHRAGMGLGARLNYGSPKSDLGPIGHIRGITYRAIVELIGLNNLKIEEEYGLMNAMSLWPKRWLKGLSGNNLFFLTPTTNWEID